MGATERLAEIRTSILEEVEKRRDEMIELCAQVVRYPTENPQGPTSALANFVRSWLQDQGVATKTVEPKTGLQSLLSTFNQDHGGPHFMFNGHLDVFPADDPDLWDVPPFEGRVADGKIHGRGVADMKGGLTASIIAHSLLYKYADDIPARISLMAVADEETGGIWGTGHILETMQDWRPDACLIGEPCSPDAVRIGEKGISWLSVTIEGRSYHGSLGMGDNCILQMTEVLQILKEVQQLQTTVPEDLRQIVKQAQTHNLNDDTQGRGKLLEQPSFNVGTINGGIKVNIAPRDVVAEVDIRVPFGLTPQDILAWARQTLRQRGHADVKLELAEYASEPNYTSPEHPLARIVHRNAAEHYGQTPTFTVTTAATDGRYFRRLGIPTVIYGPRPQGVAGLNEYITVKDFIAVLKTHVCTALDYASDHTRRN